MKKAYEIVLPVVVAVVTLFVCRSVCAQGATVPATPAEPNPIRNQGYQLVWQDDFNGPVGASADPTRWRPWALGQRRGAVNVADAARLDGQGHLVITTCRNNGRIETGGVTTKGIFDATQGYFECRCKFQDQEGLWSAFWLMPATSLGESDTMTTHGVEIDVQEYLATKKKDIFQSTIHWGGYGKTNHKSAHAQKKIPGLSEGFHTCAVRWDDSGYIFYCDGKQIQRLKAPISKVPEHLILSCEAGKDLTNVFVSWAGDIRKAMLPATFVVDWVRVWQTPVQKAADQKRKDE
jgi:beta-glucanase (GH16 family)